MEGQFKSAAETGGSPKQTGDFIGWPAIIQSIIPADKKGQNPYRMLEYVVKNELCSTKDIHTDLDGNRNREPSAWVSQIWSKLENEVYPSLLPILLERCREYGLNQYPKIVREEGRPTKYRLATLELAPSRPAPLETHANVTSRGQIEYRPDLYPKLSWLGRLQFGSESGIRWTKTRRYRKVAIVLLGVILLVLLMFALLNAIVFQPSAVTTATVAALATIIGALYLIFQHLEAELELFDKRLVIAPDHFTALGEWGVVLEYVPGKSAEDSRTVRAVRYTATCPICGAMVHPSAGGTEFPGRIVGRCKESPREHVLSFDHVTRSGSILRAPNVLL